MDLNPTEEQSAAMEAFKSESSLKINAFAGTGKTATLKMMAGDSDRKGLYLAFNKSIANEAARKFPSHVKASTSHSLAFRATISRGFSKEQMTNRLTPKSLAYVMDLTPIQYMESKRLTPVSVAHLIISTIGRFSHSNNTHILPELVPLHGSLSLLAKPQQLELQKTIALLTENLWQQMIDPASEKFPLGHDGYFKLWSLSKPTFRTDFCLLDEAQDSNPALLSVLQDQSCQVVYVGDRFQQIYEWRGAVNAMESVNTAHTLQLSQSFRFGHAIADFATKVVNTLDPAMRVVGNPNMESTLGCSDPDAILSRTNAQLIAYVIDALEAGRLPHVVGGTQEMQAMLKDVGFLKQGKPASHQEFFGFRNWNEVLEYVEQPEGESLITFVSIVEKHGENKLMRDLGRTQSSEVEADLILSTAHKSKGREWNHVMVAEDFSAPLEVTKTNRDRLISKGTDIIKDADGREHALNPEEMRLLYVASTRAKLSVHLPEWCERFFGVKQHAEPLFFGPRPSPVSVPLEPIIPQKEQDESEESSTKKRDLMLFWVVVAIIVVVAAITS